MARLGFFKRAQKILHGIFPVVPAPKTPRAPTPTPTPRPTPGPRRRRAPTSPIDPLARIWTEETLRRPGSREYRKQLGFMRGLYGFDQADSQEQQEIWREFIKFNSRGPQPYLRKDVRHPFWQVTGIHPNRFDWSEWRAMMRESGSP